MPRAFRRSGLFSLSFEICGDSVVAGRRQHSTQVDELLPVYVLLIRTLENLGLLPETEHEHVVVLFFDGSDRLEQRDDVVPFDVVVRLGLKDPQERVTMMSTEMRWFGG